MLIYSLLSLLQGRNNAHSEHLSTLSIIVGNIYLQINRRISITSILGKYKKAVMSLWLRKV